MPGRYNEILVGRYNRFLQKLFQMKGGPPVPQLATEIIATLSLTNGTENRILEGWNQYGVGITVGAVAAQFAYSQLRNPLGSNVVGIVEQLTAAEATADIYVVSITNAAQVDGTIKNVFGLDSRNTGSSSIIFSSGNLAAPDLSLSIIIENSPGNTTLQLVLDQIQELPILPGLTMRIRAGTANVSPNFTWKWRERPLEDSERSS